MDMTYNEMDGVRRSDLWLINKSPLHYIHAMMEEREQTPALIFGAAAHKMLLEPDTFLDEFILAPKVDRRTKVGRESWKLFEETCLHEHLTVISEDDFDRIRDMVMAVRDHAMAALLLEGEHEKVFQWTDDMTGELCKCKVDCLTEFDGKPYIVDYKTTDSCEDGHFERSCRKYGYQFQAGMYCEGVFQNTFEECGFAFIAQEKKKPYAVRVYMCDPDWVKRGYDKFRELIGIYHQCRMTGNWYGYEDTELIGE